jgi:hypothetical protein
MRSRGEQKAHARAYSRGGEAWALPGERWAFSVHTRRLCAGPCLLSEAPHPQPTPRIHATCEPTPRPTCCYHWVGIVFFRLISRQPCAFALRLVVHFSSPHR